eukprot:gnl/TRDRNA2_/TRDRNA2_169736_c0_seq1.p1 gnl/TRDRNA2_/TRDRNA2_169736_c0~~gnl/TRDRNA2_/TRDRNA2_169736_c0_seq1.p1  ORF type:complete len:701 (-),score=68.42 gnl/TRDRNA2_/TRDRNA2_169736_c0_seq1:68-1927(-)
MPSSPPQSKKVLGPASPRADGGGNASGSESKPLGKGVVSDITLWAELYSSESFFTHREHFENYTQWCHSAQLIPWLQRCYRRCGIAGLLPTQKSGGRDQNDAISMRKDHHEIYPLVLPTMADFCYGHCYPLHRILEYFYGGVCTIVCSVDDPQAVEADRQALRLLAGQDKLNQLCWFRHEMADQFLDSKRQTTTTGAGSHAPSMFVPDGQLTKSTLAQLQDLFSKEKGAGSSMQPSGLPKPQSSRRSQQHSSVVSLQENHSHHTVQDSRPGSPTLGRAESGSLRSKKNTTTLNADFTRSLRKALSGGTTVSTSGNNPVLNAVQGKDRHRLKQTSSGRQLNRAVAKEPGALRKKAHHAPAIPGRLGPDDPFFWFCSANLPLYTYPASYIPRHFLQDGTSLTFRYCDFVSRSGTPEPKNNQTHRGTRGTMAELMDEAGLDSGVQNQDHSTLNSLQEVSTVPPSICLCQPTEITSHVRLRWEVKKEFVDDKHLILGDGGWFPGACGHRFTYEAKTKDVSSFISLGAVPQAQLLYVEHLRLRRDQRPARRQGRRHPLEDDDDECFQSSSSSEGDAPSPNVRSRRSAKQGRGRKADHRATRTSLDLTTNVMLPPLLPQSAAAFF